MDIILIEDVEKKGKKDDVISVTPGYAYYLINNKKAIMCTTEVLTKRAELKKIKEMELKKETEKVTNFLNMLEHVVLEKEVELTPKGTLSNSITKEDVFELLEAYIKDNNITAKKNNLEMNVIKTIGKHKIIVNLAPYGKGFFYLNVKETTEEK